MRPHRVGGDTSAPGQKSAKGALGRPVALLRRHAVPADGLGNILPYTVSGLIKPADPELGADIAVIGQGAERLNRRRPAGARIGSPSWRRGQD